MSHVLNRSTSKLAFFACLIKPYDYLILCKNKQKYDMDKDKSPCFGLVL